MPRPKTKLPADLVGQTLIFESQEPLKSIEVKDEFAKVGSYAIRFSEASEKDLNDEFFTAKTDFGPRDGDGVATMFNHGLPIAEGLEHLAYKTFAPVHAVKDDIGIFIEANLNLSDRYEKAILELVNQGKLKWSSGTSYHLARKSAEGEILRWHPIEFSYTPIPAEPRLPAISPLKSITYTAEEASQFANAFEDTDGSPIIVGDPTALTPARAQMDTTPASELQAKCAQLETTISNNLDAHRADVAEKDSKIKELSDEVTKLSEHVKSFDVEKADAISTQVKAQTQVITELFALGYQFGNVDEAKRFALEGKSVADFRVHLMDVLKAQPVVLDTTAVSAESIAEHYQNIKDPAQRTEYFRKNQTAIHAANRALKSQLS
jgi:hypothetical protein